MQQPQDLNLVSANPVDDEVMAVCQKFSGFRHPSRAAKLRESGEERGLLPEDGIHFGSCANAVFLDELEDFTPVFSCRQGPNEIHQADLGNFL